MNETINSGAVRLAAKIRDGEYLDRACLNGYRNPDVSSRVFMAELAAELRKAGLQLVARTGQSLVHSSRGGAKYGKATGWKVTKIS
jgi:hypothetical protein